MIRTGTSINNYRQTVLSAGGPQQVSRYRAVFTYGGDDIFIAYPESITLPSRGFSVAPFTHWGPDYMIPAKRDYGECAMSFIIMQDWYERRYFEKWMDDICTTTKQITNLAGGRSQAGLSGTQLAGGLAGGLFGRQAAAAGYVDEFSDGSIPYNAFSATIKISCLKTDSNLSGGLGAAAAATGVDSNIDFTLLEAYPTTITPTNLSAEASGYGTFVVVFSCREYIVN